MSSGRESDSEHVSQRSGRRIAELVALNLKLGVIGFGGPAAHIAMMEDEVVRRRRWLTHEEFLDLLGATNLIPGPNSTEMAIHIGRNRAGLAGLIVAGVCFILPAMLIVAACAWAYVRFGSLPSARAILHGVKPVVIAIIVQALWRLGRTALRSWMLAIFALLSVALLILRVNELLVLLCIGVLVAAVRLVSKQRLITTVTLAGIWLHSTIARAGTGSGAAGRVAAAGAGATAVTAVTPFGLLPLFLFFLKVGAVLFGSGYVLLAFLRADLVERWHWLTEAQLLDAVAVGQVTPGPVFTTATFIGYILGGPLAAVIATLGIFLPAFVFVGLSGPIVPRLRRSPVAGAFLDGVIVASLALMALVTWQLGRAALVDWPAIVIGAVALGTLLRFRINSAWLVLGGAIAGLLVQAIAR